MTPGLGLRLAGAPLERIDADVAVVAYFADERPLRGPAARADWRLCGRLSGLLRDGTLHGRAGEAVLLPSTGGLRVDLLLALGLGERARFDLEAADAHARDAVARAVRLRAERLALAPPAVDAPLEERLGALLDGARAGLAATPEASLLVEVLAEDEEAPGVAAWLAEPERAEWARPAPAGREGAPRTAVVRPGTPRAPVVPHGERPGPLTPRARRPVK